MAGEEQEQQATAGAGVDTISMLVAEDCAEHGQPASLIEVEQCLGVAVPAEGLERGGS